MIPRSIATAAILVTALGAGVGLWAAVSGGDGSPGPGGSVKGVASGADGSATAEETKKGNASLPPESRPVAIQGVQGNEGLNTRQENEIQPVTDAHGSIQSIPGIRGIDAVMLENLETVLRIQIRPPEQRQGNARTAAVLTATEATLEEDLKDMPDEREQHVPSELEGS